MEKAIEEFRAASLAAWTEFLYAVDTCGVSVDSAWESYGVACHVASQNFDAARIAAAAEAYASA